MDNKLKKVRSGLGMLCFGILVSIIMTIVLVIVYLIQKEGKVIETTALVWAFVCLVCSIINILGILVCLFSGEKHFKQALIFYILYFLFVLIIAIIKATGKVAIPNWTAIIEAVFILLAHLSILLALRNVSKKDGFSTFLITFCILLFLGAITVVILGITNVIKDAATVTAIASLCNSLESVLLLIGIFTSHAALKSNG